jgi:hypothetical protein
VCERGVKALPWTRKRKTDRFVYSNGEAETEKTVTTAELRERTEIERIESWRRERLEEAGYPPFAARALAERHDIDLHRALNLLKDGCPVETALQILL